MRIGSAAAVAVLAMTAFLWLDFHRESFAQTIQLIDKAKSITWTRTTYQRVYSEDGKRTWLDASRNETAYLAPNLFRETRYDKEGNVLSIEIKDTQKKETLYLNMKSKKAIWKAEPTDSYESGKPFEGITKILNSEPIELIGQREIHGKTANVFRYKRDAPRVRSRIDIWIDAKTKRLVRTSSPGADEEFDPETAPDRDNPAEERISKGEVAGSRCDNIVFDAKLDPKFFDRTPPTGFEVVHEAPIPSVTEEELIEWLDVTARFNGGMFLDTDLGVDHAKHDEAGRKDKANRTDAEQKFLDLWSKHALKNRHSYPIWEFAEEFTVPGSFRYLGKGVKLGAADRVVCWYKLKSNGKYRAVYGDVTVKDVDPKSLPLPVEE